MEEGNAGSAPVVEGRGEFKCERTSRACRVGEKNDQSGRRGELVTVEHCLKKTCVMLRMVTSQPMTVVDKTFKRDLGKL